MDGQSLEGALQLLGRFNDELTQVFDDAFGTRWAEIEEMVAFAALAGDDAVTTRRLADITRLNRRAVSRMVARLRDEGLVTTTPWRGDRRVVEVALTRLGESGAAVLRTSAAKFFVDHSEIASEISRRMQPSLNVGVPPVAVDPIDLLRRVCEAGVSLVRAMPDSASQGQLAARQRAALVHIASQGGARPSDLSPALGVSRSGVAYIVDRLCAKGLVARHRDAVSADRRAVTLEATAEGIAAVGSVMDGIERQREMLAQLFAEVASWKHHRDQAGDTRQMADA